MLTDEERRERAAARQSFVSERFAIIMEGLEAEAEKLGKALDVAAAEAHAMALAGSCWVKYASKAFSMAPNPLTPERVERRERWTGFKRHSGR
jgi:hypothetical protein